MSSGSYGSSLIEERLRFQELEPTGRLLGRQQTPIAPKPGQDFHHHHYHQQQPVNPKGQRQWQEYQRQQQRPVYLGSDAPYAALSAQLTDQATSRLPGSMNRPKTIQFIPRPPLDPPSPRAYNPLYGTKAESLAANRSSKNVRPRVQYNTVTGAMGPPPGMPRALATEATVDPRVKRQELLRSQDWSMFAPANASGGASSSSGYGKAGMRPPGGGSQLWQGNKNIPGMGMTGQSERDFNSRAARMERWRSGEARVHEARKQGGMASSGMRAIFGQPARGRSRLDAMASPRRAISHATCSPRDRRNGGVNPITGRAYDASVERDRLRNEAETRSNMAVRDASGEGRYRESIGSVLGGQRASLPPNWLPSSKKCPLAQKTSFPPDADRSTDYPRGSKRVYAQANKTSDWAVADPVTPRAGAGLQPKSQMNDIFGGGNTFLPGGGAKTGAFTPRALGPRGANFRPGADGAARPGAFAGGGKNGSRF